MVDMTYHERTFDAAWLGRAFQTACHSQIPDIQTASRPYECEDALTSSTTLRTVWCIRQRDKRTASLLQLHV
jgi:hypothetical protein